VVRELVPRPQEKGPRYRYRGPCSSLRGGRDSKAPDDVSAGEHSRTLVSKDEAFGRRAVRDDEPSQALVSEGCTNVPNGPDGLILDGESPEVVAAPADAITDALEAAHHAWVTAHNPRSLRRALLELLQRLDRDG
jgi:hypothetical protein